MTIGVIYGGYRYPYFLDWEYSTPTFQDTSKECAVIRGDLRRLNYTKTIFGPYKQCKPPSGPRQIIHVSARVIKGTTPLPSWIGIPHLDQSYAPRTSLTHTNNLHCQWSSLTQRADCRQHPRYCQQYWQRSVRILVCDTCLRQRMMSRRHGLQTCDLRGSVAPSGFHRRRWTRRISDRCTVIASKCGQLTVNTTHQNVLHTQVRLYPVIDR